MTTLVLESVCKRFGGVIAADNISIEVPAGRVTGMIGPNGAGKTTIVNLITGMLQASSGRIRFGERDLTEASATQICRAAIARTFQNIRLMAEASVIENVMIGFHRHEHCSLPAALFALPSARRESRAMRREAAQLLDRFGMSRYAAHPAGALAYGHQRRVEMMRALASKPDLLLLDEPVAGMNDVESDELGIIFRELAEGGMAVLLIEHNIRFVTGLCEYLYVLDGGKMIAQGVPERVIEDEAVITAYLGA
jgi:branched-chain amino acid transport system ATP-binding protein